ncbi:MAG: prepilin-type N-terminal cleavage/methylation domain-containing protein [Paracoccaceae bacterium]
MTRVVSPADIGNRSGQSGVTLIEVMIVLVVIGIATGAATLGLGALTRDDHVEQEARRLSAAISLALDDALISGATRAVHWDAQGYQIGTGQRHEMATSVTLSRADGLADAVVLSAHAASAPVTLVVSGRTGPWHLALDGFGVRVAAGPEP